MTDVKLRKVYIRDREFIPVVAEIAMTSQILLEYEFGKAEILGHEICIVELEINSKQAGMIDRAARQNVPRTVTMEAVVAEQPTTILEAVEAEPAETPYPYTKLRASRREDGT